MGPRAQRERVLRVAGNPADFGAPEPDENLLVAGLSLCQDYLSHIRDGNIVCPPEIACHRRPRRHVLRRLGRTVDTIVCATGYDLDLPYLADDVHDVLGSEPELYQRTFHPDLPEASGSSASSSPRARTSRCWSSRHAGSWAVWSGEVPLPAEPANACT